MPSIHGRDQLSDNWPKLFTASAEQRAPAEVVGPSRVGRRLRLAVLLLRRRAEPVHARTRIRRRRQGRGRLREQEDSREVAFPAHWAPEAIAFYTGTAFPEKYRGGAFVSFHGSWNRTPTQAGFLVAFVPFQRR